MEQPADEDASIVIEAKDLSPLSQPQRKTPRRRFIQSTLFPHRSPNKVTEDNNEVEEEEDEEDEEYCGSGSKTKRKRKGKAKPRRTPPSKAPIKGQDTSSCRIENGHLTNGSEFFLKISERKLQQKQQKEKDGTHLNEENSMACTGLEPVADKRSRRQLKEKQQGDTSPCKSVTPKKTKGAQSKRQQMDASPHKSLTPRKLKGPHCRRLMDSSDAVTANDTDVPHAPEPVFDLRQEAKLAAEENARLFTGKQTHPFFSSWKMGKKCQGTGGSAELENKRCLVMHEDESTKPFHVFEIAQQDDPVSVDWSNWTFFNEATPVSCFAPENACSSFFEGIIQPLKIDNVRNVSDFNEASTLQNEVPLTLFSSQGKHSHPSLQTVFPAFGQLSHHQPEYLQTVDISDVDTEPQNGFLPTRKGSYYCGCGNQFDSSLWTDRYQPEKASEVCGNNESVRFLNEWLGSWRERCSQTRKTSTSGTKQIADVDSSWDGNESDAESMDGRDNLKNVLLVTGPVGSGKSAAIYACAKEQGFQVIEVSASDWRNGAHVKQKFGAAMESLALNKWSPGLRSNGILEFPSTQLGNQSIQAFEDEVVELVSMTCKEQVDIIERGSRDFLVKDTLSVCSRGPDKTLILFEDVDTVFEEDRGFICTIQQIAETAKRPMILTSNREDPVLPDQLDRLELSFETPSPEELRSHVHMVCSVENVDIQPQLLDRVIKCCQSDIRKTLLMLQFWCQGKMNKKDRKLQLRYGAIQFDLDAGHGILPKVFPWGFPCQLSQLVEEEITKSLSMVKENASLLDVVEEEELGSQEIQEPLEMGIDAKKEAMLSRNCSVYDDNTFPQFDNGADFSCSSGSPVAFTRRTVRRGQNTVLSSHSGEDYCRDTIPSDPNILYGDISNEILAGVSPSYGISVEDYPDPSTVQLHFSEKKLSDQNMYSSFQMESAQQIYETYNMLDVSCVPDSTFIPETQINDGMEFQSRTLSCGHVATTLEAISLNTVTSVENLSVTDTENLNKSVLKLDTKPETMSKNPCDMVGESIHVDEEMGDSHHENAETGTRGYQVMDECSRADFNLASISGTPPTCIGQASSVQETWRRLQSSRTDLKVYLTSEQKEVSQIVKLASRMTDLISSADLMYGCCQPLIDDFLEPPSVPSVEPDTFGWYDSQLEMTSTIAEHGFCLFTKVSTLKGSNSGFHSEVDLAGQMLASTSNTTVLGKLVTKDAAMNERSFRRRDLGIESSTYDASLKRDTETRLYSIIQNVVPRKVLLALKGGAFHDYVSCLGQISVSEASRLSAKVCTTKPRRRTRATRHYLSNGPLNLSPEEVSLLAKHSCYKLNQMPLGEMEPRN